MRRFAPLGLTFILAGCASMSADECLTADWQAIGYEDGARGAPVSAVSDRRKVCAKKAGVILDMNAYTIGREQGLIVYCQPSNGFAVGARGVRYNGVCRGEGELAFLDAYQEGAHLFSLEQAVSAIGQQIVNVHHDLDHIADQIAETEAYLIAPGTPPAERILAIKDLQRLAEEKGSAETALIALNRDHVRAQEQLAAYRAELAYY